MLKLDFSIMTSDERADFVNKFFNENKNYIPSAHELETITNYILYGKDPLNKKGEPTSDPSKYTNMSTRHEIEIDTKHKTWQQNQPASLDEMMESPTFNEGALITPKIIPKSYKPTFDRAQESDLPTVSGLWDAIDYYSEKLENNQLSSNERYQLRHMLIDMRREQFTLRDIFKPIHQNSTSANRTIYMPQEVDFEINWDAEDSPFGFAPMGLYHKGDARFEDPLSLSNEKDYWGYNLGANTIIDFRNIDHIDKLIHFYREIETHCMENCLTAQKDILNTLDFYITNTELTGAQLAILKYKISRLTNNDIAKHINRDYNKSYSPNYISTIYRKICGSLAVTASRIFTYYYERINPTMFKRCICCGQLKMRDAEEFTRKSRNSDGLSNKCKECENIERKNKATK